MYHILVPVDFSETSRNALNFAVDLFKSQPLKVTLLACYKSFSGAFHMKNMDRVLEEDVQAQMTSLVGRMEKEWPDVLFKPVVTRGDAVPVITSMGDSGNYDLIVMGTTGASGLKEVFLGSVAGGVVSHTTGPVLVVPSDATLSDLSKIVLAVGNETVNAEVVTQPLKTIQEVGSCEIDIVHVDTQGEDEDTMNEALAAYSELGNVIHLQIEEETVNERLDEYIAEVNADILTLIRTNKGFMNRLFKGSVTMKQAFHSRIPLLVLHA